MALPLLQMLTLTVVPAGRLRILGSDLWQMASALAAAVALAAAARTLRAERSPAAAGWRLIAAAVCLFAVGAVVFFLIEVVLHEKPYPSLSDAFYLLVYPTAAAGLMRMPREVLSRAERWNVALDMGAFALVAVMVFWHFDVQLLIESAHTDPALTIAVSAVYTAFDALLLTMLYYRLVRKLSRDQFVVPMLLLVFGGFCLIAADLLQGAVATLDNFSSGSLVDLGWLMFSTLAGLAGVCLTADKSDTVVATHDPRDGDMPTSWAIAVTYLWIAILLLILVWALYHRSRAHAGLLLVGVIGAMTLAVTRQLRLLHENAALYEDLRRARDEAERRVLARTVELHQQGAALREREAIFRALFTQSADANLLARVGEVLDCNEAALRMFCAERPDLLGRTVWELSPPLQPDGLDSVAEAARHRALTLALGHDHFEWRFHRLDGTAVETGVSVTAIELGGECLEHVAIHDISERKAMARERERLQAQLMQSQRLESIGRLAGGVAHDFNNMLSVVYGEVELAQLSVALDPVVQASLDAILAAARRSADLTRQLLAFARRQTISPEVVDLNAAIGAMLKLLLRVIGEDIELDFRAGCGLWHVRMDPSQLDQILANLAVNARDAIHGVGRLCIETSNAVLDEAWCALHARAEAGDFVLLRVTDNGCGMDAGTLEHIFEPFYTTKDVGHGTGLGLATVYGIVQQNGGCLDVRSELGVGSTFDVYLPRTQQVAEPAGASAVHRPRGNGETILLVEDDLPVLAVASQMLVKLGYQVIEAGTPELALELALTQGDQVDLLMTDIVMPGMNGRELAERIQAIKPGLPCLFVSGYTADIIAQRGVLPAGVRLLPKPLTMDSLAEQVRLALEAESPATGA